MKYSFMLLCVLAFAACTKANKQHPSYLTINGTTNKIVNQTSESLERQGVGYIESFENPGFQLSFETTLPKSGEWPIKLFNNPTTCNFSINRNDTVFTSIDGDPKAYFTASTYGTKGKSKFILKEVYLYTKVYLSVPAVDLPFATDSILVSAELYEQ